MARRKKLRIRWAPEHEARLQELKERFPRRVEEEKRRYVVPDPPPRYDEVFFEGMRATDDEMRDL